MLRLIPFNQDAIAQMVQWAEREDMKDFFRRVPPVMEWCDVDKAMAMFGTGYLVTLDGGLIGYCVTTDHDRFAQSVEISILIDEQLVADRRTVGPAAAVLLTNHAFDYMHCKKVYTKIMASRKGLTAKLESYGFVLEGTLRKSINGQDELLLGLLKEEYRRPQ